MVGHSRSLVVFEVAVEALVANAVEAQVSFGSVAVPAISYGVVAEQGKTIVHVKLCDVVHQPMLGAVAAGTVVAQSHLVQVSVAGDAIRHSFPEYQ